MQRFDDDIVVRCPRCDGTAHISDGVRLRCGNCSLSQSRTSKRVYGAAGTGFERAANLSDWYGCTAAVPVEPPRCRKCGNGVKPALQIRDPSPKGKDADDRITGVCPTCGESYGFAVRWVPHHRTGDVREPHFGLPLHLLTETAQGTIWAYNRTHAETLRDYITDGTRDGPDEAAREAMTANMPKWMKLGKNRTLVEKALSKLIKMSG